MTIPTAWPIPGRPTEVVTPPLYLERINTWVSVALSRDLRFRGAGSTPVTYTNTPNFTKEVNHVDIHWHVIAVPDDGGNEVEYATRAEAEGATVLGVEDDAEVEAIYIQSCAIKHN